MDPLKKPLRQVVHIGYTTGPRGRKYWRLTLECGHTEQRPMPKEPGLMAFAAMAVSGMTVDQYLDSRTAPEKVRCLLCGALAAEPQGV